MVPEAGIQRLGELGFSPILFPLLECDGLKGESSEEKSHLVYPILSLVSFPLTVKACLPEFLDENPRTADIP